MAIDRNAVLQAYPQYAWALDIPDVAAVLETAIGEGWDQGRLVAGLQGTEWWKKTEPSIRIWQEKQATDPSGIEESIREREAKLNDQAASLGLSLNVGTIQELARTSLQFGLSDSQMLDSLVGRSQSQGYQGVQQNLGQTQTSMDTLKTAAAQYMVGIDDNTAFNWANQINNGEKSINDFSSLFKDWAKAKFSYDENLVSRIDAGFTPADLFKPQQQKIASLLEVDASTVNLMDQKWAQVLDYSDPTAGGKRRAMTETEAARLARSTDDWKQTQNGQEAGSALLGNIRQMFEGAR